MATESQIDDMRAERARARAYVIDYLDIASRDDTGRPMLYMITKNRRSATFAVMVFVVAMPTGVPVLITREVAAITELNYTDTHRGVVINALGMDIHAALAYKLSVGLYGSEYPDSLAYRSL